MSDDIFIKKLRQISSSVNDPSKGSIDWFLNKVDNVEDSEEIRKAVRKKKTKTATDASGLPQIGQMYLYTYDAKTKKMLPYWDRYPLVFPIEPYGDGFLGINLHYLPPVGRVRLMNALKSIASNNKYDDTTKLIISYDVLKSYSRKFIGYKVCVKRYLFTRVRSKFHKVDAEDWDKVSLLPLQSWMINPDPRKAGSPPY